MTASPEFIEFLVKVPTHGKDGRDLSGDRLGPGGRRRPDGTLSAQAYDFRRVQRKGAGSASATGPGLPPWAISLIEQALATVGTMLVEEVVVPAGKKLWQQKVAPAVSRRRSTPSQAPRSETAPPPYSAVAHSTADGCSEQDRAATAELDPLPATVPPITMSPEEAQEHFDEARRAYESFVKHASALRNAQVVADEDLTALVKPLPPLSAASWSIEGQSSAPDRPTDSLEHRVPFRDSIQMPDGEHGRRRPAPKSDR